MGGRAMNPGYEAIEQAWRKLAAGALNKGYVFQALHTYTDEEGNPLHWRVRLKHPTSGDKWIRPIKQNGDGFTLGEPEYKDGKPLYNLRDLAQRPDEPVVVVEGEWCVDALAKTGVLATTSGGADSAIKANWRSVAGRSVVLWPDNDEAGHRYAEAVVNDLVPLGCAVRVIDVEKLDLERKG